jgi:hypothetical protein
MATVAPAQMIAATQTFAARWDIFTVTLLSSSVQRLAMGATPRPSMQRQTLADPCLCLEMFAGRKPLDREGEAGR